MFYAQSTSTVISGPSTTWWSDGKLVGKEKARLIFRFTRLLLLLLLLLLFLQSAKYHMILRFIRLLLLLVSSSSYLSSNTIDRERIIQPTMWYSTTWLWDVKLVWREQARLILRFIKLIPSSSSSSSSSSRWLFNHIHTERIIQPAMWYNTTWWSDAKLVRNKDTAQHQSQWGVLSSY